MGIEFLSVIFLIVTEKTFKVKDGSGSQEKWRIMEKGDSELS